HHGYTMFGKRISTIFSHLSILQELSGYAEEETNADGTADGTSDACKIFENFAKESNSAWDQLVNEHMLVTKQISEIQKASEDLLYKLQNFKVTFNAKLHRVAQLILKSETNMTRDKSDYCRSPNDGQRGGEFSSPNDESKAADESNEMGQRGGEKADDESKVKAAIMYQRRHKPLESKTGKEAADESKNKDIQELLESKAADESNEDTEEICSIGSKTLDKMKRKKRANKMNYNEDHSTPIKFKAEKDAIAIYKKYILADAKLSDKDKEQFVLIRSFHVSYNEFLESLRPRGHVDNMVMSVYVELYNLENELASTPTSCSKFSFSPGFTNILKVKDLNSGMKILKNADREHKLKHKDLIENFITLLKETELVAKGVEGFKRHTPSYPMQPNTYDCGIYTMIYMERWDGRKLKPFVQDTVDEFRKCIAYRLITSPHSDVADPNFVPIKALQKNAKRKLREQILSCCVQLQD
ncbi:hypothetical protein E2562_031092, partial [Oryza meyeriana var. granulata]